MSLDLLITRPCTLHGQAVPVEPSEYDDMGDRITAEPDGVPTLCELQQATATEERDGRLVLVSIWNLYLLPGETLTGWDRVVVDGDTYTLDGEPWVVRHPITGVAHHIEARVRRVA